MYTDQWFATTAAVEQAKRSTAMSGYDRALKDLDDLAVMEEAVVGKEEATQKLREQTAAGDGWDDSECAGGDDDAGGKAAGGGAGASRGAGADELYG